VFFKGITSGKAGEQGGASGIMLGRLWYDCVSCRRRDRERV